MLCDQWVTCEFCLTTISGEEKKDTNCGLSYKHVYFHENCVFEFQEYQQNVFNEGCRYCGEIEFGFELDYMEVDCKICKKN